MLVVGSPERDAPSAEAIERLQATRQSWTRVGDVAAALASLEDADGAHDLVLLVADASEVEEEKGVDGLDERAPHLPVVVLLDESDPERTSRLIEAGAADCIPCHEATPELFDRLARHAVGEARARMAVRRERQRFRSLLEGISDLVFVVDPEGRVRYANPAAEEITGYEATELLDRPVAELLHPDDLEEALADLHRAMEAPETPVPSKTRLRRKGGGWRHMRGSIRNLLENPSVRGLVITARDVTDRRSMEEARRRSEERFRLLARASNDILWEYVPEEDRLWWSDSALEILGHRPGERRSDLHELVHPDDRPRTVAEFDAAASDPETDFWTGLYRLRAADGSYREVFSRAYLARDDDGSIQRVVGAMMDVTERRNAERERLEAERRYRTLFDTTSRGVIYVDTDGVVVDANPAAARIIDVPLEELRSSSIADDRWTVVREDGSPFPLEEQPVMVAGREGRSVRGVVLGVGHEGMDGMRWLEVDARPRFREGEEEPYQVYTAFEDVTERRRYLGALRRKDGILEAVSFAAARFLTAENIRDEVADVLRQLGEATEADRVMVFRHEMSEEEPERIVLVETWTAEGLSPLDAEGYAMLPEEAREGTIEALLSGEVVTGPLYTIVHPERDAAAAGRESHSVAIVPIHVGQDVWGFLEFEDQDHDREWSSAELEGFRAAATALGAALQRERTEALLRERDEQLLQSQKIEAVGRLAGGIAHDFNNILTVVSGHVDLLLADLPDDLSETLPEGGRIREDLQEVRRAAERASSLTQQLLAFSRRQVMSETVLDLAEVVEALVPMLERLLGETIDLSFVGDADLWPVRADTAKLEQVVMNLVVNARDAMPDGGALRLEVNNCRLSEGSPQVLRGRAEPGEYVCLTVSDTGTGIDEATMDRIFEPFFTTKEVGKGTGLGLSTVEGIVSQSSGFVDVESEVGEGSVFTIYLPRASEQAEDGPTEPAAEERPPLRSAD